MPKTSETSPKPKAKTSSGQTLSVLVHPAKIFPLLENAQGLKESEADYFLKQCALSTNADPMFLSLKTSKGYSPVTKAKTLKSYCARLPTLGFMSSNGNCLILSGFYPKTESGFILSDILEDNPGPQIFPIGESLKRDSALHQKKSADKMISPTIDTGVGNGSYRAPYVLHWRGSNKKWQAGKMTTSPALNTQQDLVRNPLIAHKANCLNGAKEFLLFLKTPTKVMLPHKKGTALIYPIWTLTSEEDALEKVSPTLLTTSINQYTLFKSKLRRSHH